jgi:hypothetical protein
VTERRRSGASTGRSAGGPGWPEADLQECRRLTFLLRFDEAVELAEAGVRRARRDGQGPLLRRFATQQAAALIDLCRFDEAVELCDEAVASAADGEDPGAVAHAWNTGAVAASRAGRDDVLARIDAALALGEWFLEEHGRLDSLARAACTVGTVGLAELGDGTFARVMSDVEAGAAGSLTPRSLLWLQSQQISVRLWWALTLEHDGDPRCLSAYEGAVELSRPVRLALVRAGGMPPPIVACFDAFEGFALAALGRRADADERLAAAAEVLPGGAPDLFTAAIELLHGLGRLRGCSPASLAVTPVSVFDSLARAAQRCGDARIEAEVWRQAGFAADAADDPGRAALARERYDALCERLDWRYRLQSAAVLTLRSDTLSRMADGGGWAPQ